MAVAKKLPKPFQRPAIEIGGHGKAWQTIPVQTLEIEDLVIGQGGVSEILFNDSTKSGLIGADKVRLKFFSGKSQTFQSGDLVEAFTRQR